MNQYTDYQFNDATKSFINNNHFINPTPIQREVIPVALKRKDIIGISATGSGKTHAFLIPLMELVTPEIDQIQAVITAPTRELAMQLYEVSKEMKVANPKLRIQLITGGSDKQKMNEKLKRQPHIVIGTPGRIKDLFLEEQSLRVDTASILIVDEADMTLEFGFLDDVDAIAGNMPNRLQMMVFSATIPNQVQQFLKKYMTNPKIIKIENESFFQPNINHVLVPCKHRSYEETVLSILPGFQPYVCLIFANTREQAVKTAEELRKHQYRVLEVHGDLQARQRKQALKALQNHEYTYIVATDIAARGLDVEGVTHVISMGFPQELDFYIHRSGRTGRANKEGTCFALYQEKDQNAIQQLIKRGISFRHEQFRNGQWQILKDYVQKKVHKKSEEDIEIAKIVKRKNVKVKPGYKKKQKAEIEKIKRKRKRAKIQEEIQTAKKERAKARQIEKRNEE